MGTEITTALFNTVIGMGTVFVVLIFISLIISLFVHVPRVERKWKRFWTKIRETLSDRKPEHGIAEVEERIPKRPILTPAELGIEETEEVQFAADDALVAVIMAAIAASEGSAVSADRLVVRSIRRMKRRS